MREFPSQVVSDVEKLSFEYGLKVAKAIAFRNRLT